MPTKRPLLLACCLALSSACPAVSETAETTLLRPGAISYAAEGSYALAFSRNWGALSFEMFSPRNVGFGLNGLAQADFNHVTLAYSGTSDSQSAKLSYGRVWRHSLSANRVLGMNAYLDFGKKADVDQLMSQATLGLEYELAMTSPGRTTNLTFGGNVYLPFANYTAARYGTDGWVPRRGLDSYMAWSQQVGTGLRMGGRVSVFQYPATATRPARGIGTLSLTGRVTRGLPPGTAVTADLTGRYTPGEDLAPRLKLMLRRARPSIKPQGKQVVGTIQPSSKCRIVPGETALAQLNCGRRRYTPPKMHDVYTLKGKSAEGTVTVPAPERRLGYGSLYVP